MNLTAQEGIDARKKELAAMRAKMTVKLKEFQR